MTTRSAREYINTLSGAPLDEVEARLLAMAAASEDSPFAFECFFKVITGMNLAAHSKRQVEEMYKARAEEKHFGNMMFYGGAKTTVFTICHTAFEIGHHPETSNLLIQVSDPIAINNTAKIADIIKDNPGWKMVFSHVTPDIDKGWGANGYEVKRTDIDYTEWRAKNSTRKDPTLVGLSYGSHAIIGKRVSGVLIIDDILDEINTSSEREMAAVERRLKSTILTRMMPGCWLICAFTPWRENDPIVQLTGTEKFIRMSTPIYTGEEEEMSPTWPEMYDEKWIKDKKDMIGSIEFARGYLLDLKAAENKVFKYQNYPHQMIKDTWTLIGGVDYASSPDPNKNMAQKNDYFAMAYVAKIPGGGAVVKDGVLEHCTQADAELHVLKPQTLFSNWQFSVVENIGKGDDFFQLLMRHPTLKIIASKDLKKSKASKADRLVKQMGPYLESGRVMISDGDSPFLNELRKELDQFPLCRHDDALDAVYFALLGMPDVLIMPEDVGVSMTEKPREKSPFASLAEATR